jgi:hypothetical protein
MSKRALFLGFLLGILVSLLLAGCGDLPTSPSQVSNESVKVVDAPATAPDSAICEAIKAGKVKTFLPVESC